MRTLPRVALRDLLKNTDIISDKLVGEEREFAKNFVRRRVRLLIDANPSFKTPAALVTSPRSRPRASRLR